MQGNCHDPSKLLNHLTNQGDYTHTAIFVYLQTLNTFSRGHVRQNLGVNSKKKPDSDEEEKEKEREEEEEKVAAALDNNDVSLEQVDTYACDHSKQGLETQIASETHKDPVSEVTDGCESAKDVLDDIEKDITDVTGQNELWVEVCKLKIIFDMIILMRMQMINPNTN
jgi:hypothetical protein